MRIINASYEVLSDPSRRYQHDIWIASTESDTIKSTPVSACEPRPAKPSEPRHKHAPVVSRSPSAVAERRSLLKVAIGFFLACSLCSLCVVLFSSSSSSRGGSSPARALSPARSPESAPSHPRYSRPSLASNGQPWPLTSGYLDRLGRVSTNGLSSITVDNAQNSSDMLVKLFDRNERPVAVRVFFLRAHEQFKLENIQAGSCSRDRNRKSAAR